jgi:hypothetical protein
MELNDIALLAVKRLRHGNSECFLRYLFEHQGDRLVANT